MKKSIDIIYINLIILYIKLMILKDVEIYGFLLEKKLNQGIAAKLAHYRRLKKYNNIFSDLYDDMIELKEYIQNCGADAYINFINTNFDTNKFCWWENIKTKRDLKYDIKKAR